jgi:Zn finger protein HypA/HybF involved in hydrogenase expression
MKKAKKTKVNTGQKGLFGAKKEKVICCPHCKSTDYEILNRNVLVHMLPVFSSNHAQGICRKCGKKFKIN